MDHDQYEDTVTNECIRSDQSDTDSRMQQDSTLDDSYRQQRHQQSMNVEQSPSSSSSAKTGGSRGLGGSGTDSGQIFESQATYNPFDIHMGQMTVYRLRISCSCSPSESQGGQEKKKKNGKNSLRCAKILPFEDQPWTGYMGSHADSYFSLLANPYPHQTFSTPASTPSTGTVASSAASASGSKSSSGNQLAS